MKQVWENILRIYRGRVAYLASDRTEIAELNLQMLRRTSVIVAGLVTLFVLVTPLLYPGWVASPMHLAFIPAMLLFYGHAEVGCRKKHYSGAVITASCVAFQIVLLLFIAVLDTMYAAQSACFMSAVVIALPILFILPTYLNTTVLVVGALCYVTALFRLKLPNVARGDLFRLLVALCVSATLYWIVMQLRVNEFQLRSQYRSQSLTDALTGVLSKRGCEAEIGRCLAQRREALSCIFLVLDLDNFKFIND